MKKTPDCRGFGSEANSLLRLKKRREKEKKNAALAVIVLISSIVGVGCLSILEKYERQHPDPTTEVKKGDGDGKETYAERGENLKKVQPGHLKKMLNASDEN